MKIAIILFPGINCEIETKLAVEKVGMKADIVRWNINPKLLESYDGYIIPGGFSYEDRIRAGVISAKEPVMNKIKQESEKGKVVLGICNGAQVLVESGIIPGIKDRVEMALAPNINPKVSGYYCTWVNIKNCSEKNVFDLCIEKNILRMPIAHGEGRFTTTDKRLVEELIENGQIAFRYCNEKGDVIDSFPFNPNKSIYNIAALCNKKGNVMAIMPHPERAFFKRQIPGFRGNFQEGLEGGDGKLIFESIKKYLEEK